MTFRVVAILSSAAFWAGAWSIAPPTSRSVAELTRPVAAPLLLPFVWPGVSHARAEGRLDELVARSRELMRLLPTWVDGHLYLAHVLALDMTEGTIGQQLDHLAAAMAVLDEATEMVPGHSPQLLLAQAFLLDFRASTQPELARAYRDRYGEEPLVVADRLLARAEALAPRSPARIERAYLAARLAAPALRDGKIARATAILGRASAQLTEVEEQHRAAGDTEAAANAAAHRRSLEALLGFLRGESGISASQLRADPRLEALAEYLRPR